MCVRRFNQNPVTTRTRPRACDANQPRRVTIAVNIDVRSLQLLGIKDVAAIEARRSAVDDYTRLQNSRRHPRVAFADSDVEPSRLPAGGLCVGGSLTQVLLVSVVGGFLFVGCEHAEAAVQPSGDGSGHRWIGFVAR